MGLATKKKIPLRSFAKSKPLADGPFRIIRKINDNTFHIDLLRDSNVVATFNVVDLTPYYVLEVLPALRE